MKEQAKTRIISWAAIFLLSLGLASVVRAADIYLLQVGLYAIICEDGQIFSYQGSQDGLDIVVPALCEGHGGVANPGGGGVDVGVAGPATANRRGERLSSGVTPDDGSAVAADSQISRDRVVSRAADRGTEAASQAQASSAARIGRATPALARTMERCEGQNQGRVNVRGAGDAVILRCPR
jgi:hypothetical protein